MTHHEAYQWLLSFNTISAAPAIGPERLTRIRHLLAALGNPHQKIRSYVHVTGTSGKGSVALMLGSVLKTAGYKTAVLTSPHITDIVERWQIDGRAMSRADFVRTVQTIRQALQRFISLHPTDTVSFLELLTVMGFVYFAEKKVDYAVIEVGMGGRFDATNVIPYKDVAIITTIGDDHRAALGGSLKRIAWHKAGIITGQTTVVTGLLPKALVPYVKKEVTRTQSTLVECVTLPSSGMSDTDSFRPPTHTLNAQIVRTAARSLGVADALIERGVRRVRLPLRFELVSTAPYVILDGAHNEEKIGSTVAAVQELIRGIESRGGRVRGVHLIVGFSRSKDYPRLIEQLSALPLSSVCATRFGSNMFRKAALPGEIVHLFKKNLPRSAVVKPFIDGQLAWEWLAIRLKPDDLVIVTGSIFMAGELRPYIRKRLRQAF